MQDNRQDPEVWARDLHHDLSVLGAKYIEARRSLDGVTDLGELPQTLMAALVQRVCGALNSIPAFEGNPGIAALHDLQAALLDLHIGRKPALFQPLPSGGSAKDSLGRLLVKKYGILAVAVLSSCGSSERDAREFVARVLSSTGHVGRKGGKITGKTLWEWDAAADDKTKAFVNRHRSKTVSGVEGNLSRAKEWAEACLRQPGLMSKI